MDRLGDIHYVACWYLDRKKIEKSIRELFDEDTAAGILFGPIHFEVLPRDHDKVPDPDPELPDNAKFIIGSAKIIALAGDDRDSIINDIDKKDLAKLRALTQKIWRETNPAERLLKTKELDKIINQKGVEVIERMLQM